MSSEETLELYEVGLRHLVMTWRRRAAELHRYAPHVAAAFSEAANELRAALDASERDSLNLVEAARESGYSAEHLGRLVRGGEIPNSGRPYAPRIQRKDLPRKATALRPTGLPFSLVGATPGQIARAVVSSDEGETR